MLPDTQQNAIHSRSLKKAGWIIARRLGIGKDGLNNANCKNFTIFTFSPFSYRRNTCLDRLAGVASIKAVFCGVGKILMWKIPHSSATLWKHSKIPASAVSGIFPVNSNGEAG
jgi:hypothetical protein